jgi:hypothetical protein
MPKTTINSSASPIDFQRIARSDGVIICASALAAAASIRIPPRPPAQVATSEAGRKRQN